MARENELPEGEEDFLGGEETQEQDEMIGDMTEGGASDFELPADVPELAGKKPGDEIQITAVIDDLQDGIASLSLKAAEPEAPPAPPAPPAGEMPGMTD